MSGVINNSRAFLHVHEKHSVYILSTGLTLYQLLLAASKTSALNIGKIPPTFVKFYYESRRYFSNKLANRGLVANLKQDEVFIFSQDVLFEFKFLFSNIQPRL